MFDKDNKGRLIQQVNEQSKVAAELFHEVCEYYSMPSMYLGTFDLEKDDEMCAHINLRRPYFDSFSSTKWLSYTQKPLYEFLKWGIIKYLIGMNGHRRENIYFNNIIDEKLAITPNLWRHSTTLPGNKVLQDLTILGNACPEIKRTLRRYYLSGSLNGTLMIIDRLKVSELTRIFDSYSLDESEAFLCKKANKFYYQFYKELGFPWLTKDEYLLDPNPPEY